MICDLCPHMCDIPEGEIGKCKARINKNGKITSQSYGRFTAIALETAESRPFAKFCQGQKLLTVGSFGCNMKCQYCENHEAAMSGIGVGGSRFSASQISEMAAGLASKGCAGVAFDYNEPLVGYEFVCACAGLVREKGLKTALVTNGYINKRPLTELLPLIDAMNIDLKSFDYALYKTLGGDLDTVKQTIFLAAKACHVEVSTVIIPGENDGELQMEAEASWIASIDESIPLHIIGMTPTYKLWDKSKPNEEALSRLRQTAARYLRYVY